MTEFNKPFEGQELQTSSSFASNQNPPPSSYINYPQAQPYPQQIYSQGYPQNPQYIQPQPIVTNQIVVSNPTALRSSSMTMLCPFCKNYINTKVTKSCSCCNVCCFCMTTPLTWALFQLIRGKDVICMNAKHSCPNCGANLGQYEAC